MKKLFNNFDLTYKKLILFSIVCAVVTAFFASAPFLNSTSFEDIATYLDAWIVLALFVILNCHSYKEACIKCFLFFLVSQPLVYLFEAPFSVEGLGLFRFYPYWFKITLLTIPGSLIAYTLKKKNYLSLLILAVADIYYGYSCVMYLKMSLANFPYHILSCALTIAFTILLSLIVFDDKLKRIISILVFLLSFAVSSSFLNIWKKADVQEITLEEGIWSYTNDREDVVSVELENNIAIFTTKKTGNAHIVFTNENNQTIEYYINVNGNEMFISELTN